MTRLRIFLAAVALVLGTQTAMAQGFVVVVNGANPITSISKQQANAIFLKRTTRWDDGTPIAPVNLDRGSATREQFSKAVHGRAVSAIEAAWQQQIFAGKEAPPPTRDSESDVLAFVRANAGAVGYVRSGTSLGDGVKAVPVN